MQIPLDIGADVSKDYVIVACAKQSLPMCKLANKRAALWAWLKRLPAGSRIGMEATGTYHELLAILALQIVMGYKTPVFPRVLMKRPLPTRYLLPLEHYAIPLLTRLETAVRPRWPALVRASSRLTGLVILLLTFVLLTFPFPLSNIPPAAVIALIALAESERDGLLLSAALTLGVVLLVLVFAAVLGLIDGAEWILRFL